MTEDTSKTMSIKNVKALWVFILLVVIGAATFLFGLSSQHPERAWQAYLINFLLVSAIAQGAENCVGSRFIVSHVSPPSRVRDSLGNPSPPQLTGRCHPT